MLDIQHIGSTAVPGLAAKPILDLGVAVAGEHIVAACIPGLTALGYTYRGYRGPDQGHFFDQGLEQHLTHYLHMLPNWPDGVVKLSVVSRLLNLASSSPRCLYAA